MTSTQAIAGHDSCRGQGRLLAAAILDSHDRLTELRAGPSSRSREHWRESARARPASLRTRGVGDDGREPRVERGQPRRRVDPELPHAQPRVALARCVTRVDLEVEACILSRAQ